MLKQQRCEQVNAVIKIIGSHGRRFFYNARFDRYAQIELDHCGRAWFVDDYTGERVYTHRTGFGNEWRGFSHGGTLRDLVERFRDYITKGTQLPPGILGLERINPNNGNIWGYEPEALQRVRAEAGSSPVFHQEKPTAA